MRRQQLLRPMSRKLQVRVLPAPQPVRGFPREGEPRGSSAVERRNSPATDPCSLSPFHSAILESAPQRGSEASSSPSRPFSAVRHLVRECYECREENSGRGVVRLHETAALARAHQGAYWERGGA
jgi:hypothetical protein